MSLSRRAVLGAVSLAGVAGLVGCGSAGAVPGAPPSVDAEPRSPAPRARTGRTASSQRVTFVPTEVVLADDERAPVEPAATVDGELVVPEDARRLGWWDGSAAAGDPFGSTVIAGHVDSDKEGLGFFARLLDIEKGAVVGLAGGGQRRDYRVSSVRSVPKDALAADSGAFEQTGPHRLVLITCTGAYLPEAGGYQQNLVVVAAPVR